MIESTTAPMRRRIAVSLLPLILVIVCIAPIAHAQSSDFTARLAAARDDYFKALQGDREADSRTRAAFAQLKIDYPTDSTVLAYSGSLTLLQVPRTIAVWKIHGLTESGLAEMDRAVAASPSNLEARFIRAATNIHIPAFLHRRQQAEDDLAQMAPLAESAVKDGRLLPGLGAAILDYYGQTLIDRSDHHGAKQAFTAAVRIDADSPAGKDAAKRLVRSE